MGTETELSIKLHSNWSLPNLDPIPTPHKVRRVKGSNAGGQPPNRES
jgi:hypothetical protein